MDRFIESLSLSAGRFSDAMRRGPLDAPISACPGWTMVDLAHHMGFIHRWARVAALTATQPDVSAVESPPDDPAMLADWIDVGAAALVAVLAELDPAAPTWHPFPIPRVAGVWPRRQAHETQVHAWDAERAAGGTSPLEPAIALDGIAEYFEVIAPRVVMKSGRSAPLGSMVVRCDDVDEQLVISSTDGRAIDVARSTGATGPIEHVAAAVAGRAEDLLLALWGRAELTDAAIAPGAGRDVAMAWLAFGGN